MSTSRGREQPFRIYDSTSLGAALRHYRREAGLTQGKLAQRAQISRSHLSRLEGGHETEQLRQLLSLMRELGLRATLRREPW